MRWLLFWTVVAIITAQAAVGVWLILRPLEPTTPAPVTHVVLV